MSSYLLKISLRGAPNLIWRRFVVPSFTTLQRLHEIIQDVMGWQRKHSHCYFVRKQGYYPLEYGKHDGLPEETFTLDDIAYQQGTKLRYHYAPKESNWVHDLSVESIRYLDHDRPWPVYCLEGVRSCPPETCAGMEEFCDYLRIVKDPTRVLSKTMERTFASFDPDFFSLEITNKRFQVHNLEDKPCKKVIPMPEKSPKKVRIPIDPLHRLGKTLKKKAAS